MRSIGTSDWPHTSSTFSRFCMASKQPVMRLASFVEPQRQAEASTTRRQRGSPGTCSSLLGQAAAWSATMSSNPLIGTMSSLDIDLETSIIRARGLSRSYLAPLGWQMRSTHCGHHHRLLSDRVGYGCLPSFHQRHCHRRSVRQIQRNASDGRTG